MLERIHSRFLSITFFSLFFVFLSLSPYSFAEESVPTTTNLSDLSGITAVSITPQFGIVKVGESLQLKATGTFQDGSSRDVTALLTWSAVGATIDN